MREEHEISSVPSRVATEIGLQSRMLKSKCRRNHASQRPNHNEITFFQNRKPNTEPLISGGAPPRPRACTQEFRLHLNLSLQNLFPTADSILS